MKDSSVLKTIMVGVLIIVSFLVFYLLYIGNFIFVPLLISLFLFILLNGVYSFFFRYLKIKLLSIIATIGIFILFFSVTGFIITTQVGSFLQNSTKILDGFSKLIISVESLGSSFELDLQQYLNFDYLRSLLTKINYSSLGQNIYSSFMGFLSLFGTVLVMFTFIFFERKDLRNKAKLLFDSKGEKKLINIYQNIQQDLNIYFSSKFFLASINGVVATIIMTLFGLPFAMTFGLIVFLMDFVPIIGALIALGLPFLYSFVVFDNIAISFLLLLCLDLPQIITGNLIEPKIMGEKLNISVIFIIISLLFWAQLWGIVGAFLATPIIVALNVAFSRFEHTKFISIILSKKFTKKSKT